MKKKEYKLIGLPKRSACGLMVIKPLLNIII